MQVLPLEIESIPNGPELIVLPPRTVLPEKFTIDEIHPDVRIMSIPEYKTGQAMAICCGDGVCYTTGIILAVDGDRVLYCNEHDDERDYWSTELAQWYDRWDLTEMLRKEANAENGTLGIWEYMQKKIDVEDPISKWLQFV